VNRGGNLDLRVRKGWDRPPNGRAFKARAVGCPHMRGTDAWPPLSSRFPATDPPRGERTLGLPWPGPRGSADPRVCGEWTRSGGLRPGPQMANPRTWGTNTWSGREKPSLTLSHPFLKRVVKIPLGPRGLPSRGATHILKAGERRLPRVSRKAAPWLAKAHISAPRPLTRRGT
jgi:hypothetical protein